MLGGGSRRRWTPRRGSCLLSPGKRGSFLPSCSHFLKLAAAAAASDFALLQRAQMQEVKSPPNFHVRQRPILPPIDLVGSLVIPRLRDPTRCDQQQAEASAATNPNQSIPVRRAKIFQMVWPSSQPLTSVVYTALRTHRSPFPMRLPALSHEQAPRAEPKPGAGEAGAN